MSDANSQSSGRRRKGLKKSETALATDRLRRGALFRFLKVAAALSPLPLIIERDVRLVPITVAAVIALITIASGAVMWADFRADEVRYHQPKYFVRRNEQPALFWLVTAVGFVSLTALIIAAAVIGWAGIGALRGW